MGQPSSKDPIAHAPLSLARRGIGAASLTKALAAASVVVVAALVSCSLATSFDGVDSQLQTGVSPPVRPAGALSPSGSGKTLAFGVKHYHFAHSNDALKVPGAWQDWGYDIDHLCTGETTDRQTGMCVRTDGEDPSRLQDGHGCRDNNFGSQLVQQMNHVQSTFEKDTNEGLAAGNSAWVFVLEDVDATADDAYAPGTLYLTAPTAAGAAPKWDGTDVRSVLAQSLHDRDLTHPVVAFEHGYIHDHVWVSGEPATFTEIYLPIGKSGTLLPMRDVEAGVITFRLKDDLSGVVDGSAQFAGAVSIDNLEPFVAPFLSSQGRICKGTKPYADFITSLGTFVDVNLESTTLQDVSRTCDGMSFGFGMNFAPIVVPTTVVDAAPPTSPDPCTGAVR